MAPLFTPEPTTVDQSPAGLCASEPSALSPASQPVLNPHQCQLIQPVLHQLVHEGGVEDSAESLTEDKAATALPSSTGPVTTLQKTSLCEGALLPVAFLSFRCLEMSSKISCSTTFAEVEVKVTDLQLPRASSLSLRKGVIYTLFQSSETSPITVPFPRSLTVALQQFPQHPWVQPIRPHGLVHVHIRHQIQHQVSFGFSNPIPGCSHCPYISSRISASTSCTVPFNV